MARGRRIYRSRGWTRPSQPRRSLLRRRGAINRPRKRPKKSKAKGIVFRPQLTIHFYNTGGTHTGGTSYGGSATGGQATVNRPNERARTNQSSRIKALEKKVEELSLVAAAGRVGAVVVDSGTWSTNEVRNRYDPRVHTSGRVKFSKTFESIPIVFVSLYFVNASHNTNFHARVYATDVDLNGFTAHADTWFDTALYSCGVSWVAIG